MVLRKLREFFSKFLQLALDRVEGFAKLENEAGVNNVLAGGSLMHIARSLFITLSHQLREFLDQGNR